MTGLERLTVITRWECDTCGRASLRHEFPPLRSFHYTYGNRCDGRWVEVEYVPRADHRGAVDAIRDADVALSALDATPLDEPGIRQAHLDAAREALTRALGERAA